MGKTFQIKLESNDLGQILDGLRCRAEAWRGTAAFLQTGEAPEASFIPEECRDAEEAEAIAEHFGRILATIYRQIEEQGGWS